jgi:hypothetical protein
LKLEESLHLDLLDCSRSWNKMAKWHINWNCPPQLSVVHDVFHVSKLKKCLRVPKEQVHLEDLVMSEDRTYQEYPIKLLETSKIVTQNRKIQMCKVQWSHHTKEEATWERKEELKAEFPNFFAELFESRGRDSF